NIQFPPEILEKARLVRTPHEGEMTDREVVDDYIISMDKDGAIEIDDALSCKKLPNGNYLLGVHIATVLGYFPYESDIVQEAIGRNQSIYLPYKFQSKDNDFNRAIPIFPYDFSAKSASLIEGERRLARSYFFEIDEEGNVVSERFTKSIITNRKQLSYDKVNGILARGTKDEELKEVLENLVAVTERLDKRFKGTDLYDKVKEVKDDYSELRVKRIGSENIVYQAMLLTGNRVATYFAEHNIPVVYRVHHVNEENNQKLQLMINNLSRAYGGEQFKPLYQLIEGIYPKGWYATEGKHEGLDLEHYCHCTSVLRRAADILVEHALEVCYDKEPTEEELQELREEIASKVVEINAKTSPIEYFVKEYQKKYHR
ncbi:MAG: RNB domain-containing ribonuclease, partial [Malacoplasma sp.]|nr:RNB domain-containing ribonuclease [Malacoplasma sp.]